ncbi:MAG TPA: carboxymuconolactone decarboxylase family protein [Pseudonocardiaceae bacterium]|nr:carboxymuconolactone decarboxylase family protein [Pseudonocardiaceae bacterium]
MEARFSLSDLTADLYRRMAALSSAVQNCGLDHQLLELIKMRASQINGCAYCIDMHSKHARAMSETEQRLYALNAWRETPFYTERERAALALTEAITLITDGHVSDDVYEQARHVFDEKEVGQIVWAATVINTWNRLAIAARSVPGSYQPGKG